MDHHLSKSVVCYCLYLVALLCVLPNTKKENECKIVTGEQLFYHKFSHIFVWGQQWLNVCDPQF